MKKVLILACTLMMAVGCATTKKQFSVIVDPPDAAIAVIPGGDEPVQKYRSPAEVTVSIPKDPDLAAKSRLEVTREAYKPRTISLVSIENGDVLRLKLEKLVRYTLKYEMLAPVRSDALRYGDRDIVISIIPREAQFDIKLENRGSKALKILWGQAEYTDYANRRQRLMHSGIRYQDRNDPIPPQTVRAGEAVQVASMPVSGVVRSSGKQGYEMKPLFPLESDSALALKGRVFYLFLPMEIDRAITAYNFKFQITDVIKEK